MCNAVTSVSLSDELCKRAYSSTASASGSATLLCSMVHSSKGAGDAGLAGGEAGDMSCCSTDACRDSCLEVKMCQGPSSSADAGRCSAGCARGAAKGGSGTGALPPRATERCGRQPSAIASAMLR